MGWDFRVHPCSKREIVDECLKSVALILIDYSLRGNELWVVWERKTDGRKIIVVYALASRNGRWGYREISETEGPHYHKCPPAFLTLAPVTNHAWRERVVEYYRQQIHNRQCVNQLAVGKVVALDVAANEYLVTRMKPFQGKSLKDGKRYRLVKSRVVSIREIPPPEIQDAALKNALDATQPVEIFA